MRSYIGTRIIKAESMDEYAWAQYNKSKGKAFTYPMENRQGYHVVYPDGYESWSPKFTFEGAYRRITEQEQDLLGFAEED